MWPNLILGFFRRDKTLKYFHFAEKHIFPFYDWSGLIHFILDPFVANIWKIGWEPWSRGYGRRLVFERLLFWIPALHTGWTWHFFTLICCKNCIVCLKRPKMNEKEAGVGLFLKKSMLTVPCSLHLQPCTPKPCKHVRWLLSRR